MPNRVELKRSAAASFIQEVLLIVAKVEEGEIRASRPIDVANRIRTVAASHGLEVPQKCNGEAHSNPHIDNCSVCCPNWGWRESEVKVK